MTDLIKLEGEYTPQQCHELLKAVQVTKVVLLGLGGDSMALDSQIEQRLQRLSFWEETIGTKLGI